MKEEKVTVVYTCDLCHYDIVHELPTHIRINELEFDFHDDCAAKLMQSMEFLNICAGVRMEYQWLGMDVKRGDNPQSRGI